jgi:membrane-bound serine protease (ClpP class)
MLLSVLLCLIGIVAILAEFFIPSAGLIGIGGLGSIAAGIVLVFREYGSLSGFAFLAANALIVPGMIFFYWKHFPGSFMGRRLILGGGSPPAAGSSPGPHTVAGATGRALTPLRPAGTARLGDEHLSVVTDGEFLPKGTPIRVVKIEGARIIVERTVAGSETEGGRQEGVTQ